MSEASAENQEQAVAMVANTVQAEHIVSELNSALEEGSSENGVESSEEKRNCISSWFKVKFSVIVARKLINHFCFRGFRFLSVNWKFTTGLILSTPVLDKKNDILYEGTETDENGVMLQYLDNIYNNNCSMSWGLAMQNFIEFEIKNLSCNNWYEMDDLDFNVFNSFWHRFPTLFYFPRFFVSAIPHYHFKNYGDDYERTKSDKNKQVKNDQNKNIRKRNTNQFIRELAETFCQSYVPEYKTGLNRKERKKKWSADAKAIKSYRKLWKNIISSSDEDDFKLYSDFMEQVITEINDADRIGSEHLKRWKKSKRRAILLPVVSAVFTATLAFDLDSFNEWLPDKYKGAFKIFFIVLSVLAALLTAWESATKDNGNEDRETWLRQKHYLAKLKLETENFLYNWDTKNQESDNDTPQNRLNDYINKIVELRKEDWSNFFDNMNCPNYDKDYFKK